MVTRGEAALAVSTSFSSWIECSCTFYIDLSAFFALCGLFISASLTVEYSIHSSRPFNLESTPFFRTVVLRGFALPEVDGCGRDGHPLQIVDRPRVCQAAFRVGRQMILAS